MQIRTAIALLLALAPLCAQRRAVLPLEYEKAWSTAASTSSGLGVSSNGIVQILFPSPFPSSSLLFAVGFHRAANTSSYDYFSADVEILSESTALAYAGMSTTFSANLGTGAQTFFPRTIVNVPALPATSGMDSWIDFPSPQPVPFAGPHLMIQMKVFGKSNIGPGSAFKMERNYYYAANGEARAFGANCGSGSATCASTGRYMPGTSLDFALSSAPAGAAAIALIGQDLRHLVPGVVKLPFDLTPLGMTGCLLFVPPDFAVATAANSAGVAQLTLPIPNDPALANFPIGLQWIYHDVFAANPAKLLSTWGMVVRIGPIQPSNSYLWELSNVNAATGTLMQGGPIMGAKVAP